MPSLATTVLWTVITFSLLVVLHEGGHYLTARLFRIRVHEFMVGLPGPSIRYHGRNTDFGVTAIPLGGYVRIAGMEPGPEDVLLGEALKHVAVAGESDARGLARELNIPLQRSEALLSRLTDWGAVAPSEDGLAFTSRLHADPDTDPARLLDEARSDTYRGRKTWQRVVVLSAGVLVNLLLAILSFTVILAIFGSPEITLTVDEVGRGTAAAKAGIRPGDRIVSVDGRRIRSWDRLIGAVGRTEPGEPVTVTYRRDGTVFTRTVPMGEREGRPLLGVRPVIRQRDFTVWQALVESLGLTVFVFTMILSFFNPETFQTAIQGTRSVIGISEDIGAAVRAGPLTYAWLVSALSLSLGALNLLPIPPLDGGRVLLELVERILGRPLRREVSLAVSAVGAMLLILFIGYVMYADVRRLAG